MRSGLLKNWPLMALGVLEFLLGVLMLPMSGEASRWVFWAQPFAWLFFQAMPYVFMLIGITTLWRSVRPLPRDRHVYSTTLRGSSYWVTWKRVRTLERIQAVRVASGYAFLILLLGGLPTDRIHIVDHGPIFIPLAALAFLALILLRPIHFALGRSLHCPRCGAPAFREIYSRFCGNCGLPIYHPGVSNEDATPLTAASSPHTSARTA